MIWENLKSEDVSGMGGFLEISGMDDMFDLTLLPKYEQVKSYFGISTSWATVRPEGFVFEVREVMPAK